MNKITQQLSLDLVEISHNVINARQNDRLTRDLYITITNNGAEYGELPETAFAYLRGRRTDGKPVFYNIEISDRKTGLLHAELHNYVLCCPGRCKLDIGIYNRLQDENEIQKEKKAPNQEEEIASTDSFILYIPEEVFDDVEVVDSDEGSTLSRLINTARDEIDEMNTLEKQVRLHEDQRQFNETDRSNNETIRRGNENTRELMEKNRSSAESYRNSEEEKRKSAEEVRIANEEKRQSDTKEAVDNANNAASHAEEKANDLQNKLDTHHFALMNDLQSHDSSNGSHDDIRNLVSALTTRLNALVDSDDTTLDQLSEIVAYIKSNRELIDNITTSKVNVADIIDSLTSTATNKPLSAKQGKILNDLITVLTNSTQNITSGNGQADKVWKTDSSGTPGWRDETAISYSIPLASDLTRGGVKVGYSANGKNYPVQLSSEKMYVNVPWTDTNTTYPFYNKAIDGSFKTKFRTETKGNVSVGNYISNIRTDIANVESAPQFSAGIAWGSGDTNGYLNIDYYNPRVFIGGGNDDKLNWVKQLAFMDSNVASATNADTVDGKHASDFLSVSGGTITGNLRLKGSANYGSKLNFGDGDYVYLHEDTDDHLLIYARNGISFNSGTNETRIATNSFTLQNSDNTYAYNFFQWSKGFLGVRSWYNGAERLLLRFDFVNNNTTFDNSIQPGTSGKINCGTSSFRWKEIWCSTSLNTSSDRNLKKNISDLLSDERYMKFFMLLQPKSYLFRNGDSGRTHIGFISQDVEEALSICGLSSLEFAGFCKDQKTERIENEEGTMEEKPVFDGEGNPVYLYSLRYEEFIALNTMMIQKLCKKSENLENRLTILEEKMLNL